MNHLNDIKINTYLLIGNEIYFYLMPATILIIGVNDELYAKMERNLEANKRYILAHLKTPFDPKFLDRFGNVRLIIYDFHNPLLPIEQIFPKLKAHPKTQALPIIGLVIRSQFVTMSQKDKLLFEDILMMPFNWEDFLTRIDVWVNTYSVKENIKPFNLSDGTKSDPT